MQFVRVFTADDGKPRFEHIDPVRGEAWSKGFDVATCTVRELAAGTVMDWHPAPRRQLVIHLSGELEIELRDGAVQRFGPGDSRLMDDVTGAGHLTRVLGAAPVVQAVLVLSEAQ